MPTNLQPSGQAARAVAGGDREPPFTHLAHYRVVERLGHGGMGDVYLAYEEALRRHVAIKVLPPEWTCKKSCVRAGTGYNSPTFAPDGD